ncbi:MAG: 50S ribosomal protein L23 [Candidatus Omnitrophota bacterium]
MRTTHDVIKNILRTEKGSRMGSQNKHLFKVDKRSNKVEIKKAVEEIYSVKVDKVHVMNIKGKKRRVRLHEGMTASWKKAIVTLKSGSTIEVT